MPSDKALNRTSPKYIEVTKLGDNERVYEEVR